MKILMLSEFFPRSAKAEISGGVETRAFYVARELAKKHEVTVICSRERGTPKVEEFLNFRVIRCGMERDYSQSGNILKRFTFMTDAYKRGKGLDVDIVDGYNFMSYAPANWIASKNKIPAVITYHDMWLNQWVKNIGPGGILMEVLERYVLSRKWTRFIANSYYTRSNLAKAGINKDKIEVIYSGVDLKKIRSVKAEKSKKLTVCTIARLVRYKRVDDLVRAIALVKKEFPDIQLEVIGGGPELDNLKKLANVLGIRKNVRFHGYISDHRKVIQVLKSSTLFSLPSVVEGMGLVTIEAMACKVPYVNSAIRPQIEVTEGGKGGFLYKPKDYVALSERIKTLLKDKRLYRKKQREASSIVKKFDWKNITKQIEKVYNSL